MSKNHLIIGLGGTGGRVLRALRKTLYEEFRDDHEKIPGIHLGFLHVDSNEDMMVADDPTWRVIGKNVQLDPSDHVLIRSRDLKSILAEKEKYPNIKNWIGDTKTWGDVLNSLVGAAAGGQKRRLGRFLLAANAKSFSGSINRKVRQIRAASGRDEITFHIVAGLAGGTGSGIVVDVCAQLRKLFKEGATASRFRILVYCLLPEEMPKENWDTGNYHANGYACLCELNSLSTGRYKPFDIVDSPGGRLDLQDPFNGCYVFCNTNENGITVDIEIDAPNIIADFLYQKTVAAKDYNWEMLHRMENAENNDQTAETGVDTQLAERSTRFLTFGMKRLVIPNKEIGEYLTYRFALAAVQQLQYNNWSQEHGFLDESPEPIALGFVRQPHIVERWKVTNEHLTLCRPLAEENTTTETMEHSAYWQQIIPRLTLTARQQPRDRICDELQRSVKDQFENRFRGTMGVTKFFEISKREVPRHASSIVRAFEKFLYESWRGGLYSLHQIVELCEQFAEYLQERLRYAESELEKLPSQIAPLEEQVRSIERDWARLSAFQRFLGGENQALQHLSVTLKDYYAHRTYLAAWDFGRTLVLEAIMKVAELKEQVQNFVDRFVNGHRRFDYNAKNRCNDPYSADAITDDVFRSQAVKFYYPESVQKEVRNLLRDQNVQSLMSAEIRNAFTDGVASDRPFTAMNQRTTELQMLERVEEICLKHAMRAVEALGNDLNTKLLNVNIIDRLAARYEGNSEGLRKLIRKLIEHSGNYIVLNEDEVPKSGSMTKGSNQQTSHFAVVFPRTPNRTAFVEQFKQAFINEKPSHAPTIEFIETDAKPYEIVLVQITNLFPLRYVQQVASLRKKYKSRMVHGDKSRRVLEVHCDDETQMLDNIYLLTQDQQEELTQKMREKAIPFLMAGIALKIIETVPDQDQNMRQMIVIRSEENRVREKHPLGRNLLESYSTIDQVTAELLTKLVDAKIHQSATLPERLIRKANVEQQLKEFQELNKLGDLDDLMILFNNAASLAIAMLTKQQ